MFARLFALLVFAAAAASTQDPAKAFPKNYKLVLDSGDFAVMRVHYGPHEKVGMHDHSAFSTIYVYLNDSGPVRFQHSEEAKPFDVVRPPTHAGALRVSPGRVERHSVENLSDLPSDYYRVELEKFPAGSLPHEVRVPAPVAPLKPGRTVVYESPKLRIERFICPAQGDCSLPLPRWRSVVLRIPSRELTAAESERAFAHAEEPVLEPENKGWNFQGDGSGPYQLLRISVAPPYN